MNLVLFDASDNCEHSEAYRREIFSQAEFRDSVEKEYVLVYLDSPKSDGAKAKVKDARQNERVNKQFSIRATIRRSCSWTRRAIRSSPRRLCACELKPFMEMLGKWRETGVRIQSLLAAVQSAPLGEKKKEAVGKLMKVLEEKNLTQYYEPQASQWAAMLPPEQRKKPAPAAPSRKPRPGRQSPTGADRGRSGQRRRRRRRVRPLEAVADVCRPQRRHGAELDGRRRPLQGP